MCMLTFIWVNCDFVSNFFWKNIILLFWSVKPGTLRFSKLLFWLEHNQVSQISSCLLTQHIPKSITSESFLILNITFSLCWKLLLTLNRISVRDRLSCQIQLPLPNHPDPYSHFLEVDFATKGNFKSLRGWNPAITGFGGWFEYLLHLAHCQREITWIKCFFFEITLPRGLYLKEMGHSCNSCLAYGLATVPVCIFCFLSDQGIFQPNKYSK